MSIELVNMIREWNLPLVNAETDLATNLWVPKYE
jgi:hypothetical protein